jgi:hypothetical protein
MLLTNFGNLPGKETRFFCYFCVRVYRDWNPGNKLFDKKEKKYFIFDKNFTA